MEMVLICHINSFNKVNRTPTKLFNSNSKMFLFFKSHLKITELSLLLTRILFLGQ